MAVPSLFNPIKKPIQTGVVGAFGQQVTPQAVASTPKPVVNTPIGRLPGVNTSGVVIGNNLPTVSQIQQAQPFIQQKQQEDVAGRQKRIAEFTPIIKETKRISKEQMIDLMKSAPVNEREATVQYLVDQGYTIQGLNDGVSQLKQKVSASPIGQVVGNIKSGIKEDIASRGEKINKSLDAQGQTAMETGLQVGGQVLGGVGDVIGNILVGSVAGVDKYLNKGKGKETIQKIANSPVGKAGLELLTQGVEEYNQWADENPRVARNIGSVLNLADFGLNFVGGRAVASGGRNLIEKAAVQGAKQDVVKGAKAIIGQGAKQEAKITGGWVDLIQEPTTTAAAKKAYDAKGKGAGIAYSPRTGVFGKLFGKGKATVTASEKTKQAERIIQESIKNPSTDPIVLRGQIDDVITTKSANLSRNLKPLKASKYRQELNALELELLDVRTDLPAILERPSDVKKLTTLMEGVSEVKDMDELRDVAKQRDKIFPASMKNDPTKAGYDVRMEGRTKIRQAIDKAVSDSKQVSAQSAWNDMSALYTAEDNIRDNLGIIIRGDAGIVSPTNIAKGAAGAIGLGSLSNLMR